MYDIVVVGTSWGGLNALSTLVAGLPASFDVPMVIVQHRSRDLESLLAAFLQERTSLPVCEIDDKAPLVAGHIYLVPPDYHALLEEGFFSLTTDAPVKFSRPSIDVTFLSAADSYGARTIGVVLTGANDDGAKGLRRIADRGGFAIVQDPASAESPIMPRAALRAVSEAHVVPLHEIAATLVRITTRPAHRRRA